MKQKFNISLLTFAAATLGAMFVACSTEEDAFAPEAMVISPVKAPKVIAYSGTTMLGGVTRASNTNANQWNETWDCPPRPAEDLTPEELAELKALLSKGKETYNEIIIPFENYYVQQIYKGEDTYNTHDRCYNEGCDHVNSATELGSGHMDKLVAWNPHTETIYGDPAHNYQPYEGTVNYEHINNFNSGTNKNHPSDCGCGESHFGTTLMTDMPTTGFGPDEQFGFHETWGTAHDYNNYYIVEYKGYYYVGFDYEAHKYDQDTHNHGEGLDIERDWNFTDWIVRITPAYPKGTTPEDNPGGVENPDPSTGNGNGNGDNGNETPEHGEMCPGCDHELSNHEDGQGTTCADCVAEGKESDCNDKEPEVGGGNETEIPGETLPKSNEVEVNLHADEKEDGSLESHLSIHVRAATDVEIFIPIPEQYYCDVDDMEIVMKHEQNHMIHGGPTELEYKLKDSDLTVKLYIEYLPNGIRIWTEGIDQKVIDWCAEKCDGDGITFEIWNYFNETLDLEKLKEYLNQATIEFLDAEPDYYINAFTEDENDCTVSIVDEQVGDYNDPMEGAHLNGSDKNKIYENNKKTE